MTWLKLVLVGVVSGCGPDRLEQCINGRDDDQNGFTDCDDRACERHCDSDGDGYRDAALRDGTDCNDDDANVHPAAVEVCNGVDDDCDGKADDEDDDVDDASRVTMYVDGDNDGAGIDEPLRRCWAGNGAALVSGDCDDADPARSPLLLEVCDGIDNDCDDLVDADDIDAPLSTVFQDRDQDGHGDPGVALIGCPSVDWALTPTDCDDTRADVHAEALEVCDGVDNDCDGAMPAEENDADGDGDPVCTDCNDNDPNLSSRLEERCNGADDDCDGLVDEDDPSLNPYTCGYCPPADPANIDPNTITVETWNPCVLDPTTDALCSTDPAAPDTHRRGSRLHTAVWRTDQGMWRDELFLFLPPGPGRDNDILRTWAAYAGYRVLSIGYPNDGVIGKQCDGDNANDCYSDQLYETTYGIEMSDAVDVQFPDSIVGRLMIVLEHLAVEHTGMGWDRYLLPDGTPDWSRIVVAGWSNGGAQAAFLAQYEPTAGALLLSAPKDQFSTPIVPVDWVLAPGVTPGCAMVTAWHVDEPFTAAPVSILQRAWDGMGIPQAAFDLDEHPFARPPPGTHRVSQSIDPALLPPGCSPHGAVGRDPCSRAAMFPAYLYLMCTVGDLDPQTCE